MNLATTKYGHLKYTLLLADFTAIGAATAGDITIDTLPPGSVITSYLVKASTALAGGSVSAATLKPKLNATAVGTAINIFTTAGAITLPTDAKESLTASIPLKMTLTLTGDNAVNLTAGQVDVVINYHTLGL